MARESKRGKGESSMRVRDEYGEGENFVRGAASGGSSGEKMSKTLVQPVGQKRLTNVAVVRLKKHGIRFEIACYKNKVLSWRSGVEKDLDEVLQSQTVYSNVSKGILAKSKELIAAFGTDDQSKICLEALEVIRELQNHFPIKRSPMRLRLVVPEKSFSTLMEKLSDWNANITSKDESGNEPSIVCELEPGLFRDCDAMTRSLQGRLEILAVTVHMEGDAHVSQYDTEEFIPNSSKEPDSVVQLGEGLHKQEISAGDSRGQEQAKQNRCNTCDAALGDARQYREHFKSDWHKHNLKRKTRQLPPLTAEECLADLELGDSKGDLKELIFVLKKCHG